MANGQKIEGREGQFSDSWQKHKVANKKRVDVKLEKGKYLVSQVAWYKNRDRATSKVSKVATERAILAYTLTKIYRRINYSTGMNKRVQVGKGGWCDYHLTSSQRE